MTAREEDAREVLIKYLVSVVESNESQTVRLKAAYLLTWLLLR